MWMPIVTSRGTPAVKRRYRWEKDAVIEGLSTKGWS
jgi:hypothetical protein